MGIPGKALKLDEAQKNVSFHSGTNIQLGSGWKPGSIGLLKVEFSAPAKADRDAAKRQHRLLVDLGIFSGRESTTEQI